MHTQTYPLIVSGALFFAALPASADTWTGTTSTAWNVDTNWQDGTQPASGEAIVFDSSSTANLATTLGAAFSVSGISVVSPTATVSIANGTGGSLTLGAGGIDLSAATQNLTFTSTPTPGADQTWNVATGRALTFTLPTNTTFNLGGKNILKSGTGTLASAGANLSNGTLEIAAGSFTLNGNSSVAAGIQATATLQLDTGATFATSRNSGNITVAGNVKFNGGTWTMDGGAVGSFSGPIDVSANGGTVRYLTTSTGGITQILSGAVTGSGIFHLQNHATSHANNRYDLTGNNTAFTGTFAIDGTSGNRSVRIAAANAGGAAATWTIGAANTLQVSNVATTLGNVNVTLGGKLEYLTGGTITVPSGKSVVVDAVAPSTATTTLNSAATVNHSGTFTAGRASVVNLNTGTAWTQSGAFSLVGNGGYGATVTLNTGATFSYTGASPILLNPGASSNATLTLAGGTFTTGAPFQTTTSSTTPGTNNGILILQGGGTLKLSADLADIIAAPTGTAVKNLVQLGTGGGIIDTNSHTAILGQAITGAGGLTKAGNGTLALTGTNTYTGDTTVTGGTLSLGTATLADASKVKITTGATLALDHGTTDTVDQLFIDGVQQLSGTWGAPGSGAAHTSAVFSGTGFLSVTTAPVPYEGWTITKGLTTGTNAAKSDNPDNDGFNNLGEFAFDGNPLSGATDGRIALRNTPDGPTITFPVRKNAGAFVGDSDGLLSPLVDGVRYRVQASTDLMNWNTLVFETAPDTTGLPALSDAAGWEYRTFQIAPGNPKAFLRVKITDTP
ncbi:autotransporter-associated beta strand repeat-containing protein [Luteolibacter ambystomatis]|uniref:Autotransporter-associated beta strand repeat-containing protein n=1 Tax=Luteolibacter ambystomatis TaxID=2824561 RepID=A0A975J0Y6_9BACT|nr:autotransporter-associated beta strand repeat-containing protein [Luteolibacter ambystomatis]QUE51974.1 autotransporter-associated beta strand repeat-containing protein [Luteolibacter ambystomatis]